MQQDQVKEHFSRQAGDYEKLMVNIIPQYLEQHQIIQSLLPDEDRNYRVLDLGCGNGILSEIVFRKLPQSHIIGFDLTEDMLKAFAIKLSQYSGKFELKQGDFRNDSIGSEYVLLSQVLLCTILPGKREKSFTRHYMPH